MTDGKRIVICLDGTWQNPYQVKQRDDGSRVLKPSNVLKLARAVLPVDPSDRPPQITYYDVGIGAAGQVPGAAERAAEPCRSSARRRLGRRVSRATSKRPFAFSPTTTARETRSSSSVSAGAPPRRAP